MIGVGFIIPVIVVGFRDVLPTILLLVVFLPHLTEHDVLASLTHLIASDLDDVLGVRPLIASIALDVEGEAAAEFSLVFHVCIITASKGVSRDLGAIF